jgi:hypothetical protein
MNMNRPGQRWISSAEFDRDLRSMQLDTEREIMRAALGEEEFSDDPEHQLVEEGSEIEGFDGDRLSMTEIAHGNLYERSDTGYDRPVELQTTYDLAKRNAELEHQNALLFKSYEEDLGRNKREVDKGVFREKVRGNLLDAFGDDDRMDALIQEHVGLQNQVQQLQEQRVNASLDQAHRKYGRQFDEAFETMTTSEPNAMNRSIVANVWGSENPGERLMELADSPSLRMKAPGFMHRGGQVQRRQMDRVGDSSGRQLDHMGWGDSQIEQDVFGAALAEGEW